jgi:hypothetical protein
MADHTLARAMTTYPSFHYLSRRIFRGKFGWLITAACAIQPAHQLLDWMAASEKGAGGLCQAPLLCRALTQWEGSSLGDIEVNMCMDFNNNNNNNENEIVVALLAYPSCWTSRWDRCCPNAQCRIHRRSWVHSLRGKTVDILVDVEHLQGMVLVVVRLKLLVGFSAFASAFPSVSEAETFLARESCYSPLSAVTWAHANTIQQRWLPHDRSNSRLEVQRI